MAPLTKTAAGICVVLCLFLMNINGLQASEEFKVTALFNITANSTCGGDTPTTFVHDGQEFDCSFGEHSAYFSLDNNHTTWWQSNNTDDPVSVSFFLDELEVRPSCIPISGPGQSSLQAREGSVLEIWKQLAS